MHRGEVAVVAPVVVGLGIWRAGRETARRIADGGLGTVESAALLVLRVGLSAGLRLRALDDEVMWVVGHSGVAVVSAG